MLSIISVDWLLLDWLRFKSVIFALICLLEALLPAIEPIIPVPIVASAKELPPLGIANAAPIPAITLPAIPTPNPSLLLAIPALIWDLLAFIYVW